jgi:glycosyltransferase involved in cell wall biosynthesis
VDADYSKMVDAVITTSDYLADEKRRHNPSCFVVKNGVDIGMFKPFAKKYVPSEESSIIGYIGNLDMRFDVKLMEEVVKLLPQYQFHFTGSVRNAQVFDTLSVYPNVRFFKPVKPEEVPALLAGCSVGVIPYTCNEINKNIYPLKINEYLAVGVPVVMTPFAQLPEFSEMVDVAGDALSFAKCIVNQIETDSAEKTEKRKTFAAANSWEKRASEFSDIIHILTTPVK